jgi:hypothetical protein
MISSLLPTAADMSSTMLSVLAFTMLSDLAVLIPVLAVSVAIVSVTLHFGEKRQASSDQQPEALHDDADSAELNG